MTLRHRMLYQLSYVGLANSLRRAAGVHRAQPMKFWWTGEDSNLRSPQGAADLQSAAINRSATRPQNSFPLGWSGSGLELAEGIEPPTVRLQIGCSTN